MGIRERRTRITRGILAGLGAAVLLVVGTVTTVKAAPAAAEAAAFTVYMAPAGAGGSDANDGLSSGKAVATLPRVQQVLQQQKPTTDVEVRIKQGTYIAPPFHEWRFYVPGHKVSFMPIDYVPGQGVPAGGLPVFKNATCGTAYCAGFWLQPRLPRDTGDPLYGGGDSNLDFRYLRVEYYSAGGVSVYGDSERDVTDENYNPPLQVRGSKGLNHNTFFGMQFRNLGSKWSGGSTFGYGGIVLTNSSNNRVENSHFINIENAAPYQGNIHGLYITHFSSNNQVVRNKFSYVSGYVVKSRNMSNYNSIEYNDITRAGRASYYRGEFCDTQCAIDNKISRQCASYHDRFFNNTIHSGYSGGQISTWSLSPEGLTNAGGTPCAIPAGEQRVLTGGNSS
ncbi:hypothetical protein [Streptomyces sp. NPDC020747]|uniref:hypothetical protein n=1 Tax=Streptomyces sp. NPDC020747 TaxID=3365086 RepID=UPI0037A1924D